MIHSFAALHVATLTATCYRTAAVEESLLGLLLVRFLGQGFSQLQHYWLCRRHQLRDAAIRLPASLLVPVEYLCEAV